LHSIAIAGGGAAGLATAIFAAERVPGARVAVLDGARSLGAKILISGGGRCNVTNALVSERDFNGGSPAPIRRVLRAFPVPDTARWFARLGVPLHEEAGGKLFPDSSRARDVVDALVGEARARGVALFTGQRVEGITRGRDAFTLVTSGGLLEARLVVLATGGLSVPSTGSDGAGYAFARALGHSIVPTTPALVPLVLEGETHRLLQGVSHDVRLTFAVTRQRPRRFDGPMLWTHFGVSGPAILDLSRHWLRARLERRDPRVTAALAPFWSFEDADTWFRQQAVARPRAHVGAALGTVLPQSVADCVTALATGPDGPPLAGLSRDARRQLAHWVSAWPLSVTGSRGYTHAEVTAGGVALSEIDPATMASRICPGLFLVGEVLDVDGRLGGFNFQWAWSSARAAAEGLAASLR
jgi:predicted Rossmann fold flavoprotein